MEFPEYITNEKTLDHLLSVPYGETVSILKKLDGDVIFLGVSGKMGLTMAWMAKKAFLEAGKNNRVIGVSRFSNQENRQWLEERGIDTLAGDLLNMTFLESLPHCRNVIYLAGTKFGTRGNEPYTWMANSYLPGLIAHRFRRSRIVALSTGCVYPLVDKNTKGSRETNKPDPVGEYAQSCLGRERMFQYGGSEYGTPGILIRLNYAVEMRYGVIVDIAQKVLEGTTIDLSMGYANVIWQGDASNFILQSLSLCKSPTEILNITSPEMISVKEVALLFAEIFKKVPVFSGKEEEKALLSNASEMVKKMGKPRVSLKQIVQWTARWISENGKTWNKPTHFEVRDGEY